ncbi:hypothetical protein [Paludisphaera sp.]|uniref:hypothetical protein n=1 Tax=Paludisphaera sp. TaxID=2017432 RepID=UPI00301E5F87
MAGLVAVVVAADPRISHMALCLTDCPPAVATAPSVGEPAGKCCSTAPTSRPQPPVDDHDDCGCDCCHIVAGYRTERDARSTFVSPAPLKIDFPAAVATFFTFWIVPPPSVAVSTPVVVAAGAGSLPCLLCNHLRT